jgi:hypothetical protein
MSHYHERVARLSTFVVCAAVALALVLTPCSGADAAWNGQGYGGAAAAADLMPAGSAPSGTVLGNQVTVSWPPATFANGVDVAGYIVNRYNASTGASATVGNGCSGVVTTTSCTETSVAPGPWLFTETPVEVNWTGGQSADSAPVVVGPT